MEENKESTKRPRDTSTTLFVVRERGVGADVDEFFNICRTRDRAMLRGAEYLYTALREEERNSDFGWDDSMWGRTFGDAAEAADLPPWYGIKRRPRTRDEVKLFLGLFRHIDVVCTELEFEISYQNSDWTITVEECEVTEEDEKVTEDDDPPQAKKPCPIHGEECSGDL